MKLKIIFFIGIFLLLINQKSNSQTNAGTDQEICNDYTVLAADPPPLGYTGTWEVISGACDITDLTLFNTTISTVLEGFNELKWTITDGTNTYNDAVIIQNNYPTQAYTAADEEICQTDYTLNANLYGSGESGLWSLVSGSGTIANPTVNASNVSGLAVGINKFEWKISKGICFSDDTLTFTNNIVTADAGIDQTICEDFTNLNANNPSPGSGTWSVVSSSGSPVFGDIHAFSTTITGLGVNTNSLQWTVQRGSCTDYANVIITSNKPTTANAGTDQITCDNHTFLSGNNPVVGNGTWTVVSGNGIFNDANAYNTQVTAENIGINKYEWKIDYNGCTSADTVQIMYDYFLADAGSDDSTCIDNYSLIANDPSPGTGEWRVTGGSGTFVNAGQYNTDVSGLVTGDNTYEWKITRGACVQTDYVTISRNTPSAANAGPDKETCNGNVTLAAVNPSVGTGSWSVVSGSGTFTNSILNNTTVTNIGLNDNIFRWTVQYASCSNDNEVTVTNNSVSPDAGINQIVCGTTSTLNAIQPLAGETGSWKVIAGTSIISNTALYNSDVTGLVTGFNNFRWTLSKGSCENYDDIEITNNLYPASASISGLPDVCDDFASIIGNAPPAGGFGYWTVFSGAGTFDNSLDLSTVVRNIATGTNLIHWTLNKDGCENYDEIQINRNSVFADAGADQNICVNHTFLNGNQPTGNLSGDWTRTGGTGAILNTTLYNTEVIDLTFGINIFKWTLTGNGCSDDDLVQVTNNGFITSAGSNQQICLSSASLTASDPSPGYGIWDVISGNGTFSNPSINNTTVTGISDLSNNEYRWTEYKNGCSDADTVTIQNNQITADAGADFSVCSPWATLNGNDPTPGTGVWTIQVGGGNLADNNSPSSLITNLSLNDNIIRWTVTNNTCINYDEVTITNNTVTATAGGDQAICKDSANLSGQQPINGEVGLWEIVSGNGIFQNQTLYNTKVTNLASGFNTFRWTISNNGCNSGGDDVIINNKSFQANAGIDQALPQFITTTQMGAILPAGGTGNWILLSGGGNITSANDPSSTVTNLLSGINKFQWTVLYNGCSSYDAVDITTIDFEANAGIDKTICSDSLILNAQDMGGTPQVWSVVEGTGTFDNSNDPGTWVRNISEGINRYRWSVTISGATDYDDIIITRINAHAGADQIICDNYTNLNGNIAVGSLNSSWSLVSGNATIENPTLYNTAITNIGNSNNLFQWTVYAQNCTVNDYVTINYENLYSNAGSDQILCQNQTTLSGNNPSSNLQGSWSVLSGSGTFDISSKYNTSVSNIGTGNNVFSWTVYTANCSSDDDVLILNDELTADAGADKTVTQNQTYLNAGLPANTNGLWDLISGSGNFSDINDPSTFVSNLNVGENFFRWTIYNNNCVDYDEVILTYDNTGTFVPDIKTVFEIFPNPTNGIIHLNTSKIKNYNIEVYTLTGNLIFEQNNVTENNQIIDISDQPAGVYFIKFSKNNKNKLIKLVKK